MKTFTQQDRHRAADQAKVRLDSIEKWTRRTFFATLAGVLLFGLVVTAVTVQYVRASIAIGQAFSEADKNLSEFRQRIKALNGH